MNKLAKQNNAVAKPDAASPPSGYTLSVLSHLYTLALKNGQWHAYSRVPCKA
jgi:hypothetical protein